MNTVKVGILFGGCGEEHPISVKSAQEVAASLDTDTYEPVWIGITRSGAWKLCDGPGTDWCRTGRPATLSPDRAVHGLLVQSAGGFEAIRLDVVLPVLHGKLGEDGTVQGLLELSGIPYAGCDVQSSAICMDKSLTYAVARGAGIPTPQFSIFTADEYPEPTQFDYPVFVKPARSGSSFGITKVSDKDTMAAAIQVARQFDSKVVIEQAVDGIEVGCAILGDASGLVAGEIDQIVLSHGFFRIHQESNPEAGSDNSTPIVPANIPPESRAVVHSTARSIYRALGCRGLSRVDMFLTADGTVVLNEVNTLPGLTSYSRYPRMMAAAGLSMTEVLDRILSAALTGTAR